MPADSEVLSPVSPPWSADAIRRLRDDLSCPACGRTALAERRCTRCGADFRELGGELWDASLAAATALEARQAVLARVPREAPGRRGRRQRQRQRGAVAVSAGGPGGGAAGAGGGAGGGTGPAGGGAGSAPGEDCGTGRPAGPSGGAGGGAGPAGGDALGTGGGAGSAPGEDSGTGRPAGPSGGAVGGATGTPGSVGTPGGAGGAAGDAAGDAGGAAGGAGGAARASEQSAAPQRSTRKSQTATVQSVLAVAGAGLVAIAAIVFTFFNPDLTSHGMRSAIVAATTLVFFLGAHVLMRRGLRFSAETVGALGAVFVALDIVALADAVPANPWLAAAIGTLIAGTATAALALATGIRIWLSTALVALTFVPAMLGAGSAGMPLAGAAGWFGTAVACFALIGATPAVARRFDSGLRAERVALTIVQLLALAGSFAALWFTYALPWSGRMLAVGALFAAIAVLALFSGRHPATRLWGFIGGGAAVAAPVALVLANPEGDWAFAVVLTAAVVGFVLAAAIVPLPRGAALGWVTGGATTALATIAAVPTLLAGMLVLLTLLGSRETPGAALALATGLAALALGLRLFIRLRAGRDAVAGVRWLGHLGSWYAVLAALVLLCVSDIPLVARVAMGLVLAVGAAVVAVRGGGMGVADSASGSGSGSGVPAASASASGSGVPAASASASTRLAARLPLLAGMHLLVLAAAVLSWRDDAIVVWAGAGIVAATLAVGRAMPASVRFVYVGAAYAYALVVFATGLRLAGTEPLVLVCLTTSLGAVVAVSATFARAVPARSWLAILVVTAVPFATGVLQVIAERSGWTALSTSLMFALALTLVVTRRPGLGVVVRALAAAAIVPSLAVVAVCLGAQLLPMSGSPVVLPVVAVMIALVLPSTDRLREALVPRIGAASARVACLALEASALVTAAIAVGLALTRDAAGLGTALLVLMILGVGGLLVGSRRPYGGWLAAAAFTGALWCAWGLAGVALLEAYVLPPALGAALVGALRVARGGRGIPLYAGGLLVAVGSVLASVALSGSSTRTIAVLAAAWGLVALGVVFGRSSGGLSSVPLPVHSRRNAGSGHAHPQVGASEQEGATRVGAGAVGPPAAVHSRRSADSGSAHPQIGASEQEGGSDAAALGSGPLSAGARAGLGVLAPATFAVAIVAGAAGAVQGVRLGLGWDAGAPGIPLILLCLALGVTGAAPAALAARGLASVTQRWLYAPAFAYAGTAAWTAIERDWFTIWTMWGLMLAYLVALFVVSLRTRRAPTALPPVWFVFALAFTTAVVAWSPRDLRVEWFSLPLGAFLLAAGAVHLRSGVAGVRSLTSWPENWRGSWALLTPGILVLLSASIAATFTDPLTWRAILVIVLALAAILVGASRNLAAPFVIGIVVLPVENVLAFLVQIGRGIDAMPWWITLAVVGAVLLIIAVTYERRAGGERGVVARLRDLA